MKNIKIELKWAIIFILVALIWMVLEKLVGLHDKYLHYHIYLSNLFAIPAIWILFLALKDKKERYYNGKMTYMQGLVSGIILSVIIALISPLAQWVTTSVISPNYFSTAIRRSVEIGDYQNTAAAAAYFNYKNYVIQGAVGALIMGIFTSAFVMIFIQTKEK